MSSFCRDVSDVTHPAGNTNDATLKLESSQKQPFLFQNKIKTRSEYGSRHRETRFMLIGRRCATGYTLCGGFLLRHHKLDFTLEGTDSQGLSKKNTKSSAAVSVTSGSQYWAAKSAKDKFSAGKLLFDTALDDLHNGTVDDALASKARNIKGRLPNHLCDFLVPLLQRKLITLSGHIAYDLGPIGTFQGVQSSTAAINRLKMSGLSYTGSLCTLTHTPPFAHLSRYVCRYTFIAARICIGSTVRVVAVSER